MARRNRVPATRDPSYLGRSIPPRGWLLLHEGREITCTGGHYYLDPRHTRKGHHLVAMGGKLYEVQEMPSETKRLYEALERQQKLSA